ncbi:MAG: thioether cross-link-forming SCIFF peptide maturase [Selenomonadaceae bacterium]|nr:thioether cross-link-forming SCIFF peptide maturase [Selenomonadaceae bacterium]
MDNRIHLFKIKGKNLLYDIESSSLHEVDDLTAEILSEFDGENDGVILQKFGDNAKDVIGDLHFLINEGSLFAPKLELPKNYRPQGVVKSLCLMVAEDCNLACKYCFADGGTYGHERAIMSPATGIAAIDFLLKTSPQRQHYEIDFFGGEPLLNMETLKATTKYARDKEAETGKSIKLTVTTNGVLLTDDVIDWLNENNISVVLSLDGRKEVHDKVRKDRGGNPTYDKVLKNFQKLVKSRNGENYYIRGTYTRENLDFTKDVAAMYDVGFRILSMEPVVLKGGELAIRREDLPRIFEEYDRLTEYYLEKQKSGDPFNFFHFNIDLQGGPCLHKRIAACGAGHEYYAVSENGDLYPCHQFVGKGEYKLGNIVDGVTNKNLPDTFRNAHIFNKEKCSDCFARYLCSGGCHANAVNLNNNLLTPYEIGCEIQKKRAECALYILSEG